jgi:UDP-N-acetylmuramoyl-tripeptide--D-alanyl-D-alanine ligase
MYHFTADTLWEAMGGRLLSAPRDPEQRFTLVTDSRRAGPGQVFVPLTGPSFDGHDFLEPVLKVPDTGVIGLEARLQLLPPALTKDRLVLAVADPLTALGDAAAYARQELRIPIVGLTGSSGKTTTKDLIRGILEQTGPGLATEGNLNNLIGLPLMVLRIDADHEWAVLELGMNAFGEIERMARIARPTVRLITNIGFAHTEGLGGIDGVARAKGELFATARPGDFAVVNLDDPRVASIPLPDGVRRLTYGAHPEAQVRLIDVRTRPDGTTSITLDLAGDRIDAHVPIIGRHNALNATAAAAVAYALEAPANAIVAGLAAAKIAPMRMQRVALPGDVVVLNDAYNANPSSMEAALDALLLMKRTGGGRAVAVLGDMLELGALEDQAHRRLGEQVAEKGLDRLFACGRRAVNIEAGALAAGMPRDAVTHDIDHAALAASLHAWLMPGDVVLIKGSRGSRMEKVLQALQALRGVEPDSDPHAAARGRT